MSSTNLTRTIVRPYFELFNTSSFAVVIVVAVVDAACQRRTISIKTFIPIVIFCDILKYGFYQ